MIRVRDFADQNSLSVSRVHQLIAEGHLEARQGNAGWTVERVEDRFVPLSRPLSSPNAWALLRLLAGLDIPEVSPTVRHRLRGKIARMRTHRRPDLLLMSWIAARATPHTFSISSKNMHGLLESSLLSNVSRYAENAARRGGLDYTAYISPVNLRTFIDQFTQVESAANVVLYETENVWASDRHLSDVLSIADRFDRDSRSGPNDTLLLLRGLAL